MPAASATPAPAPAPGSVVAALPEWLQPGVSPGIHLALRTVLVALNALLGFCAVARVLTPHFEIMFLLSLALTGSYWWFMQEIARIHAEEQAARASSAADVPPAAEGSGAPADATKDKDA